MKDAHDTGRNLITSMLPADVTLIRSWAGHPFCMVQELDESFDAVMMIGYHAAAGSEANSLAHTLSSSCSISSRSTASPPPNSGSCPGRAMLGVPTVFVTGDKGLMEEVKAHQRRTSGAAR